MTASPELLHELRASRPVAPAALRARTRELGATGVTRRALPRLHLSGRHFALVVAPAAVAISLVSAGLVGLVASGGGKQAAVPGTVTLGQHNGEPAPTPTRSADSAVQPPRAKTFAPSTGNGAVTTKGVGGTPVPTSPRAQSVAATLTVQVASSDGVSRAAQDALDLVRSLGGYVVSSSVATGEGARASLTVRVPVTKVQEAIAGLSGLGKLTSQQVTIDDLQESLDALGRRAASLRSQIVAITARLDTGTLDPVTRAQLEARRRALRSELRAVRRTIGSTSAEARLATVQLSVVTAESLGVVPTSSRLDRTLHGALNALVWEGVVALAILVVAAPFLLVAIAAWLGHRLHRRRQTERLLAT